MASSVTIAPATPPLSRRSELKALIVLALPIIGGQLAQTGMSFVDTLMAGAVSPQDLAAVAVGSSVWVPMFLFIIGTLLATTANVSHLFGAERHDDIAPMVRQALWLSLLIGALAMLLLLNASPLLGYFMDGDTDLQYQTQVYLNGVAVGVPAIAMYQVLRYLCEGMGHTRPAMLIAIIGLICNAPLNYLFIYGGFGIPAMGGAGCGWATGIVMWIMLLAMLGYISRSPRYRHFKLLNHFEWPRMRTIADLMKLGVPIGLAIFMESSMFAIIALLLTPLGATVVSGHQITLNFTSMSFMFPLSIAMAITIRVGQALGAGQPEVARFRAFTGLILTLSCALISCLLMRYCGEQIASLYSNDGGVIRVATELMLLAALFQFSDATQVSVAGALRGYKDTRIPMLLTCVAYWCIGLPLGWQLALGDLLPQAPMGAPGFWWALIAGLTVAALLLLLRLQKVSHAAIQRSLS
ncbi:MATE family efflux transporter [Pokkaliibacter plantistimulans]|uniref:Multidrug-efflux transporter n=1 Tax=Proteobacteria bacterium 228 TaxID=2083153 RepID=A0A2S5KQS8_9PROT|nr:MATE family efflux transporter [Pokkaliibacter plantistimulans]PPC77207.1 MATE family efflux transporter [Pokkaliibacter plantistimulans]